MNGESFREVGVIGAGSWGTALAIFLAERSQRVTLWGHDAAHIREIQSAGVNQAYLPDVPLPSAIRPTADLAELQNVDLAMFVTPSRALREVAAQAARVGLKPAATLLSCTKGIEHGSGLRMSEVLAQTLPGRTVAVLSGPSHAEEVARGGPTAVVLGCGDELIAEKLQSLFNVGPVRAYTSDDVAGIELGGALKNVFAIAAGVSDGLGFGDNAKAALVTRALAELIRLGTRLGGRPETFQGLSGIGDLMVTCFSGHSRNRLVGERLGRGEKINEIVSTMRMVAEGVPTASSAFERARAFGVATPIIDQVNAVLTEGRSPAHALKELFLRDPKPEHSLAATEGRK